MYGDWDRQIEFLISQVNRLQKEIVKLKKEIEDKTIEKNLYSSSLVSQNEIDIDHDQRES